MKNYFATLFLVLLPTPVTVFAQESSTAEILFEVNLIYSPLSMSKEKLHEAQNLDDLNEYYETSWVREYVSVEVSAFHEGRMQKSVGKNESLTQEQKDIMNMADIGSEISVVVRYIPENTLSHNDVKVYDFSFIVNPEREAKYIGGREELRQFLKENAIDKIPNNSLVNYDLATIKFTIDEEGRVTAPHVFWPFENKEIDELLLETICQMPNWEPAEYANGKKIKQEFAFTVGNMENCTVNLLNIRKDSLSANN